MFDQTRLTKQYTTDGFVALPGFVCGEELQDLQGHVERFVSELVSVLPPEDVFCERKGDRSTLKQIQRMSDHDPWFHQLLTTGRFRELAETLLGGPVVPRNLQYFSKPPGVGRPTPPHQDGYYFMLDPCEAVTMWLALDVVDAENGCVRYVRGSQRCGMREHARTDTLGFSQGIVDYPVQSDLDNEVLAPAEPGDLLVHDAMTIHRADGNASSGRHRRALGLVYFSDRARVDSVAHAAYQQKLAAEMKASGKI